MASFRASLRSLPVVVAAAGTSTALLAPPLRADGKSKLPIYDVPSSPVTLVETHTALESQVGDARRFVQHSTQGARSWIQEQVDKWIGVERRIENRVIQLIPEDEPLTPGILYVGVATLAGSVFTRYRSFPIRFLAPPLLLVGSLNYFLPHFTSNLSSYYVSVEREKFPSLTSHREALVGSVKGTVSSAKESIETLEKDGKKGWSEVKEKVEASTGLRISEAEEKVRKGVKEAVGGAKDKIERI